MKGHGQKLSRNQEKAVIALLTEPTLQAAAEKVGIGETTLYRWMQLKEFDEQFRAAKREAFNQAIGRLQQASTMAVDTLCTIMESDTATDSSRVRASEIVLNMSLKAIEMQDIEKRLTEIEEHVKGRSG